MAEMSLREEKRREELESETKKLDGINAMIAETIQKTKRVEAEFAEEKNKYSKSMLNLRNLEECQELRRNKLNADINIISQREVDLGAAEDANAKLKAELSELQDTMPDYDLQIEKLEQEIKDAYLEWETFKENQVMIEVGLDLVRGEERSKLNPLMEQKWTTIKMRQQDLNKELAKIDSEISGLEAEVAEKQRHLKKLKGKEAELLQTYSSVKEYEVPINL